MKQGLFTDVNAVIKEEIAGLKNIKIHLKLKKLCINTKQERNATLTLKTKQ